MNDTLNVFGDGLNVAVIGASGGLGGAFTASLINSPQVSKLYALSRGVTEVGHSISLDLEEEASIAAAAAQIKEDVDALDLVIIASGLLHDGDLQPEKSLRDISAENFQRIYAVNTIGPALVAKHFTPLLPRDRHSTFAAVSAYVGSLEKNEMGGWYAYRASKTALNMVVRNVAIEVGRRFKQACIIGLDPGTVDTDLSKPFQKLAAGKTIYSADDAAQNLLHVIGSKTAADTGRVYDYNGVLIPN